MDRGGELSELVVPLAGLNSHHHPVAANPALELQYITFRCIPQIHIKKGSGCTGLHFAALAPPRFFSLIC